MKVHLPFSFFSLIFLCQLFLPNIILAIPEFSMCSYSNCYMDIVSQRKSKYVGEKEQAQVGRLKSIQISKSIFVITSTDADNSDQSGGTSPPKGCCKYRKDEQGRWGKKKNYSFDKCKEENQKEDNDGIRKQSGKWWWDDNC